MTARETDFAQKFSAEDNPFKLSIARLIPPKQGDETAPTDAFLIKLRYVVTLPLSSDEDRDMFHRFVRKLEQTRSFCGLWTPELSEPYFDDNEASVELTSYLRKGMEDKILHLDELSRSWAPKRPSTDEAVLVEQFMIQLRSGAPLKEAVITAEKEAGDILSRGRGAETEIESDGLATGTSITARPAFKGNLQRPPPGPALSKTPVQPGAGGPPQVQRAEEPPPPNELQDSPQLYSKEKDSELEAPDDTGFDISLGKKKPVNR
jgi:hypothetical protein